MARDTTLPTLAAHGRRRADTGDRGPWWEVWEVRIPAHYGVVTECGVAGGQGSGAADLATRRAEGTAETATARTVVAERWIVYPAATGTSESRLELRLCKSDDP